MADMFGPADLETMQWVRAAFDPDAAFNPGKVFPSLRRCGEKPEPGPQHPAVASGEVQRW
jgi:glycolate oxidase